jgi:hypothetical protein
MEKSTLKKSGIINRPVGRSKELEMCLYPGTETLLRGLYIDHKEGYH